MPSLQRIGVDAPFQNEEADRQNIDCVSTHAALRARACQRMIRKSVKRFSEKIMRQQEI
jgi:hypothetical protein